jgi:hypothetical protein
MLTRISIYRLCYRNCYKYVILLASLLSVSQSDKKENLLLINPSKASVEYSETVILYVVR